MPWLHLVPSHQQPCYWLCRAICPFLPLAFQAEGVLSLPASVRLSVRKLYLVCTITRHKFELESPNVHQTCILGYSQLVLKMEVIDLDLQGHFGCFDSELLELRLVHTVTFYGFEIESPNLHQMCILGFSQLVLKMGGIDLDLQGHLAISTHKTAFNVALVHWSKRAKGCYTSQTCSCLPWERMTATCTVSISVLRNYRYCSKWWSVNKNSINFNITKLPMITGTIRDIPIPFVAVDKHIMILKVRELGWHRPA